MKMQRLISLGLWLSPFVVLPQMDTRTPKEFFVLAICLALSLLAVYRGEIKAFTNKWALLLMGWFIVNIVQAPTFEVTLFQENASNFWVWKPFLFGLVYLFAIIAISSMKVTAKDWTKILKAFIYPALIMSVYCIFQWFGLDQWFGVTESAIIHGVTNPHVAGTMGQPTIVAPFIAMCVPFALYGRKYLIALIMIIAVCMTKSMVSIGSLVLTLIVFLSFFRMRKFCLVGIIVLGLTLGCAINSTTRGTAINKIIKESSGRFEVYPKILKDFNSPIIGGHKKFVFTGLGAGSFKYVFAPRHAKTGYRQAHNEYLEVLYNFGFVGVFLFFASIYYFIKRAIPKALEFGGDRIITILCSLFCISICAGGTFVWQIGTTAFYTVVLVGLLHNNAFLQGETDE